MIRKPLSVGSLVLLALVTLSAGGAIMARELLSERRDLLIGALAADMETSVVSVAGLVGERARDIRSDLLTAVEMATHGRASSPGSLELVRAHLIALDRSTKHYRRLWHVRDGEVITEVSGFRRSERPIPDVSRELVIRAAASAAAQSGSLATLVTESVGSTKYERLQLFALADRNPASHVIAILVSMDALFDSLQRRARLPGADLWVVDAHGNTLVTPGDTTKEHQERVVALLTSEEDAGSRSIGPVPSPWPFSSRGHSSQLVVWRSARGPTIRWSTGIVTSLHRVGGELKETAAQLIVVGAIVFVVLAAAVLAAAWYYGRQLRLRERVAYHDQLVHAERLSTLGQIAASVAHEIGTPLGVISIRLDQLLEKEKLADEHDKISVMKDQIERITRIMRRMLDYARPRSRPPQRVALKTVVGRVQDLIEHRLRRQGVSLRLNLPDDIEVIADFDELHQVFLNLLVNALDACKEGGRVSINVVKPRTSGRVCVAVTDSGSGVPKESANTVFEPFFSTKPAGDGTGLGLTIVKNIMQRQSGSVRVAPSSHGSCLVLEWPAPDAGVSDRSPQERAI